ncbi:MAG: sigma-54-dependent transcriptional regulator [Syntrophales bacterium]
MIDKPILIVDDEKNIRLTLSQVLETLGAEIDTAANGEEALTKLKGREFGLVLLDIRMPGMDGMEILRRVREIRPDIRVIMITAYGTIESAIEAMKLGAADFLQKPFDPEEIRELVSRVADRDKDVELKRSDYASSIECAKNAIRDRHFDAAIEHVHRGISIDPGRPEAFNLLGAMMEIKGDRTEAQKNYRAALSLDPSYQPAIDNLHRSTTAKWKQEGGIILEDIKGDQKDEKSGSGKN